MLELMVWDLKQLRKLDLKIIPILLGLMVLSVLVITSHSPMPEEALFSPKALTQIRWFAIGWALYLLFASLDYNRIREATWILYILTIIALIGLFFMPATVRVHRWYRIPLIGMAFQPSEVAKLIVVFTLAWFLEKHKQAARRPSTALQASLIALVPFLLIYKQPDLGTALVLWPITMTIFYFGGVHRYVVRFMGGCIIFGLLVVFSFFTGILDHEEMKPYATHIVRDYQYERLNPNTHHHWAAATAISAGGTRGTGWKEGSFSGGGWLPAAETDSVFPSLAEEFGIAGTGILLALCAILIYRGFQVTAVARDDFGRLLSAGITVYIAMHALTNLAMMCGFLPITGVPLLLVTYGGTSVLVTMSALGILQSIHIRR